MIDLWTDGSGTHDLHGPACIGVVVCVDGEIVAEASEHVGEGTNNVAELRAIRRGLRLAEELGGLRELVTVHSDSQYAIGAITKPWAVFANAELVEACRRQARRFAWLRWEHVPGHAGVPLNELADWLASRARRQALERLGARLPKARLRRRPELEMRP